MRRRVDGGLIIRDSRPVATWRETVVTGIAARVYECCDRAQSLPRIVELMQHPGEGDVTQDEVCRVLDEFVQRKLMAQEGNRYLSLAVMTFMSDFERRETEVAPTSVGTVAGAVGVSPLALV